MLWEKRSACGEWCYKIKDKVDEDGEIYISLNTKVIGDFHEKIVVK